MTTHTHPSKAVEWTKGNKIRDFFFLQFYFVSISMKKISFSYKSMRFNRTEIFLSGTMKIKVFLWRLRLRLVLCFVGWKILWKKKSVRSGLKYFVEKSSWEFFFVCGLWTNFASIVCSDQMFMMLYQFILNFSNFFFVKMKLKFTINNQQGPSSIPFLPKQTL